MKDPLNSRQRLIIIIMDVLLLAEITLCIWLGSINEATMTETFIKLYVPMCLATVVMARICIRHAGRAPQVEKTETGGDAQIRVEA